MINSPQYIPQYQIPQQTAPNADQNSLSAVARYAQPRYSGVSIEIIEPQVKVPQGQTQSVYNYPTNSVYAPQAQQMPYMQQGFAYPQMPMNYTQPALVMPQPQQPQILPPAPPAPAPASIIPANVTPVTQQIPAPAMIETAPVVPSVIQQPVITYEQPKEEVNNTDAPAVNAQNETTTTDSKKDASVSQEVETPVAPTNVDTSALPAVELATVVTSLRSDNIEEQAKTMENISTTLEKTPEAGLQYIDVNVVNALVDVLNKDTSKLDGPTPRQQVLRQKLMNKETLSPEEDAEAKSLSQMEAAERNKQYSLYTIAMIQNTLGNEVEKKGMTLPLNELPAIENVITTAKDNPNPMLRASALAGLAHIAKPEYSDILGTIFQVASTSDEDATVQGVAKEALAKLKQINADAQSSQATK